MNKLSVILFVTIVLFSFSQLSCKKDIVNPSSETMFSLNADEIVSTEALIKLEYALSDSVTVRLKRNGQTIVNNLRMYREFVLNDTLLQPKQTYTYTAYKLENGNAVDSSLPLQISTMDTTSNDFMWQTFTFGNGSSSVINDVTIINDTLIYAVGEIYILDSTGQDETIYNAAKWDGKKWELKQISVNFRGNIITPALEGIFALSPTQIWLVGGLVIFGDGSKWIPYDIRALTGYDSLSFKKCWGSKSNAMYFVGLRGSLSFYNGTTWQKLESGTTTHIQSIWGIINKTTQKEEIFCAVTDFFEPKERKILRITNTTTIDSISWNIGRDVVSVWTYNGITFYSCGDGIFRGRNGKWKEINFGTNFYTSKVLGNGPNDVFVVGSFGLIAHYNGNNWKWFPELFNNNISYSSVAVHNNLITAVGFGGGKGIITLGKRK